MFPCLHVNETFVAETFFVSEKQKMFLIFFRNILFPQQMFPLLRIEETMLTGFCGHIGCNFPKICICKRLFSVKSFLVYLARKRCFPHVCAPKKHSGKQCFHINVSLFAGALSPLKYQAPTVDYEFHAPLRTEGQVGKHKSEGTPI